MSCSLVNKFWNKVANNPRLWELTERGNEICNICRNSAGNTRSMAFQKRKEKRLQEEREALANRVNNYAMF